MLLTDEAEADDTPQIAGDAAGRIDREKSGLDFSIGDNPALSLRAAALAQKEA